MTMFWWARALKASHMEQARGYLNAYTRGLAGRETLEIAFGHIRAVVGVEQAVEKEKRTLRDENAIQLTVEVPQFISRLLDVHNEYTSYSLAVNNWDHNKQRQIKMKVLEVFDLLETKHRHIIYS